MEIVKPTSPSQFFVSSVVAAMLSAGACDPEPADGAAIGALALAPDEELAVAEADSPTLTGLKYAFVVNDEADKSVLDNVLDVAEGSYRTILDRADAEAGEIVIEYVGKGKLGNPDASAEDFSNLPSSEPDPKEAKDDPRAFILFSPDTRNTFRVHLTDQHVKAVVEQESRSRRAAATAKDHAAQAQDAAAQASDPAGDGAPRFGLSAGSPPPQEGWSTNNDSRARIYGVNATVSGVNRWMVHFSSNCSGAQVGTSTVITAAHCLWNRANGTWSTPTLRVGRNGTSVLGNTVSNIKWYLVPPGYQDTSLNGDPFDIGYIVMWDELDGGTFNGQNFFIPKTLSSTQLETVDLFNRGYPACNNFFDSGENRIDEPCQGFTNQTCTATLGIDTCQSFHVYGDSNECSIGNFSSIDADGWNRNYQHSCDASAAQSGSVLYGLHDSEWSISAVHFLSLCGKTATDVACTSSDVRALKATRITPTYLGYYTWLMATKD